MAETLKPAYLIWGDDGAKIDQAVGRLRARAEQAGGAGALETHDPTPGGGPDVESLIAAMPAFSLMSEHRYLLADGVERWRAPEVKRIGEALTALPEDVTVVLVAHGAAPKNLGEAVKKAGGEVHAYQAPKKRALPGWVVEQARGRGLRLHAQAARTLIARVGASTIRLAGELDRIALWAGDGGEVGIDEIEELTADSSERKGWTLGDAVVARDRAEAVASVDELIEQGEAATPLIYGMASRLRSAYLAAAGLEAGRPAKEVAGSLPMAPYPSELMVRAVKGVSPAELSDAIGVVADLEWWTRGGSDYTDEVALTLAVRLAAGGRAALELR